LVTAPASAQTGSSDAAPTCPRYAFFRQCLTALSADLDGDKRPDQIGLIYSADTKTYQVAVNTAAGLTLAPFEARVDLTKAKISLTIRSGRGDRRCRLWIAGGEDTCGYPATSNSLPSNILYLSDSVHGEFAIYLPSGGRTEFNETGRFVVMPALEGAMAPYPLR
jgi:hypothetical protein